MLHVCKLSFDYQEHPLLHNVEFALSSGQLLYLRGDNGAGKTTLIRLLTGLLQPLAGDICWNNQSIYQQLPLYQQDVCYVGHKLGLSPHLTVTENCFFDMHGLRQRADFPKLLAHFGLQRFADVRCYQLSAGQKRRVSLLRLAMTRARLWLLDEPLVALDADAIGLLSDCVSCHLAQGGLIVLSSHQPLPTAFGSYQEYVL